MADHPHGFLKFHQGHLCFTKPTKKALLAKLGVLDGESYVVMVVEDGFVAVPAKRYFNGKHEASGFLVRLKALDAHISKRIREDDEILQKLIFNGETDD